MPALSSEKLLTAQDLLAIPEDGVERWLIDGKLWEQLPEFPVQMQKDKPVTVRNRFHSRTTARVATILNNWRDRQPAPRGEVYDGEAGVRLAQNPDSIVGIDVVYISAELASNQGAETTLIEGIPVVAAEVLSPSDLHEQITGKVKAYLNAGVALVWLFDPYDQTVKVYRRNAKPRLFNSDEELTAEPELPGFKVAVADFFS